MALKQLQLSLQFGDIPYATRHRAALPRHAVTRAIRHALADDAEITVRIDLARGHAQATVWTCDLSYDYVKINADYRS